MVGRRMSTVRSGGFTQKAPRGGRPRQHSPATPAHAKPLRPTRTLKLRSAVREKRGNISIYKQGSGSGAQVCRRGPQSQMPLQCSMVFPWPGWPGGASPFGVLWFFPPTHSTISGASHSGQGSMVPEITRDIRSRKKISGNAARIVHIILVRFLW